MNFDGDFQLNWLTLLLLLIFLVLGFLIQRLIYQKKEKKLVRNVQSIILAEQAPGEKKRPYTNQDLETALKALFDKRKQELQRLQQLENYRRDYIGNVSHELKTPLFAILGYLDNIEDDDTMDKETIRFFISKANRNLDRVLQLVQDLDTVTKFESGFLVAEKKNFDVLGLITEVIESLEMLAKEKSIHFSILKNQSEYRVYADPKLIRQVVSNLFYNSIKYGKNEGHTRVKLTLMGHKVHIEVADNGLGIPAADLPRIFERFYRVEKSRHRDAGGSGLGLSICKHILEAHNETIEVISTEGAGSIFSFDLPTA